MGEFHFEICYRINLAKIDQYDKKGEIKNIYSSLKTIEETNDAYSIPFLTWHHSVYGVPTQCETVLCNLQQT